MIKLNGFEIKPTMFPDKTSQVWKIDDSWWGKFNLIEWEFEHEGEIVHVAQLKDLLAELDDCCQISLHMSYLPYARQDKKVANDATFALFTFAKMINAMGFHSVSMLDPHSDLANKIIKRSIARSPMDHILPAVVATESIMCFPDAGALSRYASLVPQMNQVHFEKDRDQATGNILGIKTSCLIQPTSYIIVDDICDGGRTFIEVAKALYAGGAKEVHLYVTHGIFSKGVQVLRDAGIKRIFTHKGEL